MTTSMREALEDARAALVGDVSGPAQIKAIVEAIDAAISVADLENHENVTLQICFDKLRERCEAYKGQVEYGAAEIAKLKAELRALNLMYAEVVEERDAALSQPVMGDSENRVASGQPQESAVPQQIPERLILATVAPAETEAADVRFVLDALRMAEDAEAKRKFIASFRKQIWSVAAHNGWDAAVEEITSRLPREEQRGFPKWHPIETAPKDGTTILVAVSGDEYEPASVVWVAAFENWFYPTTGRYLTVEPTHWMPLPSPPVHPSAEKA